MTQLSHTTTRDEPISHETVLGPEFVFEALRTDPVGAVAAEGRTLRFLANVDPVDVARATSGASLSRPLSLLLSLSLLLNSYNSFIHMKSSLHYTSIYAMIITDSRSGPRVHACCCRVKNHDDC